MSTILSTPSPSSTTPSSSGFPVTGGLSSARAADFQNGVCQLAYFSDVDLPYGICIGGGSVIFPQTACQGSACQMTSSVPKLTWGRFGDWTIPPKLTCDGGLRTVSGGRPLGPVDAMGQAYYVSLRTQLETSESSMTISNVDGADT